MAETSEEFHRDDVNRPPQKRRPILREAFRVWCKNQVADYEAILTAGSLVLQPLLGSSSAAAAVSGVSRAASPVAETCCQAPFLPNPTSSSGGGIEIPGRDVVACRPAAASAVAGQNHLGPPVLMLVTYNSNSNVRSLARRSGREEGDRAVLYFHWSGFGKGKRKKKRNRGEANEDDEVEDIRRLVDVLRIKEQWVNAIHQVFFPLRSGNLVSNTARLALGMAKTAAAAPYLAQKLLVVLNPAAGDGSALKVFRDRLAAVLKDAGAEYEVLVSERRGHVTEVTREENLARWRGVVAVGGDGTLGEVVQGLFQRSDWQDALSHLSVCSVPVPRCSSAFARSMSFAQAETFHVTGSALNAARCQVCPLDLLFVQSRCRHQKFNHSSVATLGVSWTPGLSDDEAEMGSASSSSSSTRNLLTINKSRLLEASGLPFRRLAEVLNMRSGRALISYLPVDVARRSSRFPLKMGSSVESSDSEQMQSDDACSSLRQPHTCSTCSLTDRENLYEREPTPSTSSSSSKPGSSEGDDESLDALIPPKRVSSSAISSTSSNKYAYPSLLAQGQLYFRSWQELDERLGPSGPFPLLNGPVLMKPSSNGDKDKKNQSAKRPKPCFPSMPDLPKSLPRDAGWVTEVGDFVCVHLINHGVVTSNQESANNGFQRQNAKANRKKGWQRILAPNAKPDDGCLWLLLVRAGVSRKYLMEFLKRAEKRIDGNTKHDSDPLPEGIELIKVRGLRIAPLEVQGFGGFSVDGDQASDGDPVECLQAFVMPGVARAMVK